MTSVLEERSATAVHATLTALVRTNAATSSAWADYEAVFLDPATASFFESRLPDAKAAALVDSESNPPPSKKKAENSRTCKSTLKSITASLTHEE